MANLVVNIFIAVIILLDLAEKSTFEGKKPFNDVYLTERCSILRVSLKFDFEIPFISG
jgi:hypothetical protein